MIRIVKKPGTSSSSTVQGPPGPPGPPGRDGDDAEVVFVPQPPATASSSVDAFFLLFMAG